jgi:uncharacterized protein YicC (UPF0701 family)
MTAYASVFRRARDQTVQIVLRSLNFKYLDISIHNLPTENILLEEKIKRQIKAKICRGKIEVFVFLSRPQTKNIYINQEAIARYLSQIKTLAKKHKLRADINIGDLLNLPQVISWQKETRGDVPLIFAALKEGLNKLLEFKKKEGLAIKREITNNLTKLKNNVGRIKKQKPKINQMENGKEDIDEELSLTAFYIAKMENKVQAKQLAPKGKSLDFLTQEILRELNAASSKTKKKQPALLIVEAKNYLERIREQAQNLE